MVVPKKNGKFGICVDFRKLNVATQKYPYPLPFTNEVLNIVARSKQVKVYRKVNLSTLTLHCSYNYHKITSN
jgi:hypothetical protein